MKVEGLRPVVDGSSVPALGDPRCRTKVHESLWDSGRSPPTRAPAS